MIKILYIANYREGVGGISGQVKILYDKLDRTKYKPAIFNTKGNLIRRIVLIPRLVLLSKKFDVLHVHGSSGWGGFFPVIVGMIVGSLWGKKRIVTFHGGNAEKFLSKYPKQTKFFLNKANTIIVLSGYLENVFQKHGFETEVIPNVVNPPEIKFGKKTALRPRFISIRYLNSVYNVECIIRAFKIVCNKFPNAALNILGDGEQKQKLERLVKEENIKGVRFSGRVSNMEVYGHMKNADILLSAPLIDNMPVSILEAFSAGLIVISSNVGGVPFMIKDGENGYLFESNNHTELAEKMMLAIEFPEKSQDMIKKGKESLSYYSWESVSRKIYQLYTELQPPTNV